MAWELRSKSAGNRAGFVFAGTSVDEASHAEATEVEPEMVPTTSEAK